MSSATASARRPSHTCAVGDIAVGGGNPVVVQSMTNTDTADVAATVEQVGALVDAGSEIVRVTVNTRAAAQAVPEIDEELRRRGIVVPLVGDFHFTGHRLLSEVPDCARTLAKYRINPGNVGRGARHDENFATMVEIAASNERPVRIGVNAGSLDPELLDRLMDENAASGDPVDAGILVRRALVRSALDSARAAEELGLPADHIVVSCKVSRLPDMVAVYEELAARSAYPLHLGLTEAGVGAKGIVSTSAALAILLRQGIGDTIRASLTPEPGGDRTLEVKVCRDLLQCLGIRSFRPQVTACPGCGRTTSTLFQELALRIEAHLEARMAEWRHERPGAADLNVAVMGCVVNGPGESRAANIGLSLPGTGETPRAPVYVDGEKVATLEGPSLAEDFIAMVERYVIENYPRP